MIIRNYGSSPNGVLKLAYKLSTDDSPKTN